MHARIPLPSKFNFEFIEQKLRGYHDKQIMDLLMYGFPLGHNGHTGSKEVPKNHTGARFYPSEIEKILKKETKLHTAIGPFDESPFGSDTFLSPINSVPKKDSESRRFIMDLSMPKDNSINDGIEKDSYLDQCEKLTLPSIDQLVSRVMELAKLGRVKLFKVDLACGYRQFFICPKDINLLGYDYKGKFYFDCTLCMGSRSSTRCCQQVTDTVVFVFTEMGFFAINYLDDLGSAELEDDADEAFAQLQQLLLNFGLKEAFEKSCAPTWSWCSLV